LFKNDVMRRIFESKLYDVTGDWKRLHNEEVYDLFFSSNNVE